MGKDKFCVDLYDVNSQRLYPSTAEDEAVTPPGLVPTLSNVVPIIRCGGIWIAKNKFGVSWKLLQAVVNPPETSTLYIHLSPEEKEQIVLTPDDAAKALSGIVEDSDDEEEEDNEVTP